MFINKLTVVEVLLRTGGVARQVMLGSLHRAAQTVGSWRWHGKPWQCEAWRQQGEWTGQLLAWAAPRGIGIGGMEALELDLPGIGEGDTLAMDLPGVGHGDLLNCRRYGLWSAEAAAELKGQSLVEKKHAAWLARLKLKTEQQGLHATTKTRVAARRRWKCTQTVQRDGKYGVVTGVREDKLVVIVGTDGEAAPTEEWEQTGTCRVACTWRDGKPNWWGRIAEAGADSSDDEDEEMSEPTALLPLWWKKSEGWRELLDRAMLQSKLVCYSDGSVRQNRQGGTYAYLIYFEEAGKMVKLAEGGGKASRPAGQVWRTVDSYRVELLAIASGMELLLQWGWAKGVEWHTDSQSVMDTYASIEGKRGRRWQTVRERDVWRVVKTAKGRWGNRFKLCKVKAHADNLRLKNADGKGKAARIVGCVTRHQHYNILVDALAEGIYASELPELGQLGSTGEPCVTIDGLEITGRLRASLHRYVRIARVQRYAREKGGLWWGDAERVDWDMMMTIKPKKANDREYMRHMWGQLPTHDKPWMKETEGRCPCGCAEPETQWHMIRTCGGEGMGKMRKKAVRVAWSHLYSNPKVPQRVRLAVRKLMRLEGRDSVMASDSEDEAPVTMLRDYDSVWDLPEEYAGDDEWSEMVRWWVHNGMQPIWNGVVNKDWVKMWETHSGKSTYLEQRNWARVQKVMAAWMAEWHPVKVAMWKARNQVKHSDANELELSKRKQVERAVSTYFSDNNIRERLPAVTEEQIVRMSRDARDTWMQRNKMRRMEQLRIHTFVESRERMMPVRVQAPRVQHRPKAQGTLAAWVTRTPQANGSERGENREETGADTENNIAVRQKKRKRQHQTPNIMQYMLTREQGDSAVRPKSLNDGGARMDESTSQVLERLHNDVRVSKSDLRKCAKSIPETRNAVARKVNTADEISDELVSEVQGKRVLVKCGVTIVEYICVDVWFSAESERWEGECVPRSVYQGGKPAGGWPRRHAKYIPFADLWMRVRRWRRVRQKRKREQRQEYDERERLASADSISRQSKRRKLHGEKKKRRNYTGKGGGKGRGKKKGKRARK